MKHTTYLSKFSWRLGILLFCLGLGNQLAFSQTLTVDILSDTIQTCLGGNGVVLNTNIQGGLAPYDINWSPSIGLNNDTTQSPLANPAVSTWYTVVVIDANLDSSIDSVFVSLLQSIPIAINPVFDQCFPNNQFSFSLTDTVGFDSVLWFLDQTASISSFNGLFLNGVQYNAPGQKSVSVVGYQGSCISDTATIDFWVSGPEVEVVGDTAGCQGDTLSFFGNDISLPASSGAIGSWQWDFSNGMTATSQNITQVFGSAGTYSVTLTAIDSFGCFATDTHTFSVAPLPTVNYSFSIQDCKEVSFVNNSSPGAYLWDFGDGTSSTSANPTHIYSSPGTYFVMLSVSNSCGTEQVPQSITILPNCVWPGDANNDLVANNLDILALGLAFGQTGPLRPNASQMWEGQGADNWNDTLPNGANFAYTDSDGNGIINEDDTLAINTNYGLTHNKKEEASGTGTVLYFDTTAAPNPIMVGTQLEIPIMLGTATDPADSVYGIAFTLTYDMDLVDSATASLHTTNSWIGTNILRIEKDFYLDGELDGAICRKDQTGTSNQGQIARATFVMVDDIAKQVLYDTLRLGFKDVYLIRADGSQIPVSSIPAKIVLFQDEIINSNGPTLSPGSFQVFPNPVQSSLQIRARTPQAYRLEILNLAGQSVSPTSYFRKEVILDVSQLPVGLYLLRISHKSGSWIQKLHIQ